MATKIFKDKLPQKIKVNENVIKFFCARISTEDWKTCKWYLNTPQIS